MKFISTIEYLRKLITLIESFQRKLKHRCNRYAVAFSMNEYNAGLMKLNQRAHLISKLAKYILI